MCWARYPPRSKSVRNLAGTITLPLVSSECSYLPTKPATGLISHDAPRTCVLERPSTPFRATLRHSTSLVNHLTPDIPPRSPHRDARTAHPWARGEVRPRQRGRQQG